MRTQTMDKQQATGASRVFHEAPGAEVRIGKLSPKLGAEITGLDIRDDTRVDAHWAQLESLLKERHLLLFRDQDLDEASMGRFALRFGEFERSVTQRPDGSLSEPVHMITNLDAEGRPSKTPHRSSNYFWHADKAFRPTGSAMVLLHGIELPPEGGDTQFADMVQAYEGLSDEDKHLVAGLRVVHSFEHMRNNLMKRPLTELERQTVTPPHAHPLVRTDPRTGRKSLFLGMYACEIVGMPIEEGQALIARLHAHAVAPAFVYTHQWRKGDFLAWDNLALLHRALPNFAMESHRRVMMRCGIKSNEVIY
jgi:alpha-ketoglutarate-dependent taurine dioxygenase